MRIHLILFLFASLCLGALGIYGVKLWLLPAPSSPQQLNIRLGERNISVPQEWIANPSGWQQANNPYLDLRLTYPELSTPHISGHEDEKVIILHLTPADIKLDPADRASTLYPRFLSAASHIDENGLRVQDFDADSAYSGETLYVAPPEGRVFAARCITDEKMRKNILTPCLFSFREGDVDVEARFPSDLLMDWQNMALHLRQFVEVLIQDHELRHE